MRKIRLLARLRMGDLQFAKGVVLPVPSRVAAQLVEARAAEYVEEEPVRAATAAPEAR